MRRVALLASCATALVALTLAIAPAAAWAKKRRPAPVTYVAPVPAGLLALQMNSYRTYARGLLGKLNSQLSVLLSAEQAGDLSAAQADWLPAHLDWLDIGEDDKAYGAFGELGQEIDGTTAGLIGGIASKHFTGFHKVEYDLWTRQSTTAAATDTIELEKLLAQISKHGLDHYLRETPRALGAWVLRCHEILEDADRDTLTADDDYGSGTGVASVTADVAATREMLDLLAPSIGVRVPGLVKAARNRLRRVIAAADATRVDGQWVGIAALPMLKRESLDAAVGAALEKLAPVSEIIRVSGDSE